MEQPETFVPGGIVGSTTRAPIVLLSFTSLPSAENPKGNARLDGTAANCGSPTRWRQRERCVREARSPPTWDPNVPLAGQGGPTNGAAARQMLIRWSSSGVGGSVV